MKRLSVLVMVLALLVVGIPQSAAAKDGDGRAHFGPYAGSSPDSGTCGNDWAQDTFKRFFSVRQDSSGVWQLREDFKEGKFVTVAGFSPGACETSGRHGHVVTAGVEGTFHGYLSGSVTGGSFDPDATCSAPCGGDKFVAAFFGAGATWNVVTFKFTYHAEGADLAFRHWQNASDDQGGNQGDIATD